MNTYWWQLPAKSLNLHIQQQATAHQQQLTKPLGALGQLETLAIRLAAMQGRLFPHIERPFISIFAADHGISAEGVSAYPSEVTAQMVANFAYGGAAICVLSKQIGAQFEVVDVGVASNTQHLSSVIQDKTIFGTANFLHQTALNEPQLHHALKAGKNAISRALANQADCFIGGEMGIGNTTSASALACVWLKQTAGQMTGAGTGLDTQGILHKTHIIERALKVHQADSLSNLDILKTFGGCEIVALTGAYIAAAQAGLPIIVDGFISSVAALAACKLNPNVQDWLLFGHLSAEKAHKMVLSALNAQPLLQLDLRLGEGSGAASAYYLLPLACALHQQMATFSQASVSHALS